MDSMRLLGKLIKDYMDARYIKSEMLATSLGYSSETISKMLNGSRKISAIEYLDICDTLGVKPDYFRGLMKSQKV